MIAVNQQVHKLGLLVVLTLIFCNCNRIRNTSPTDSAQTHEIFSSTPPFKTIEPERYQAIRVVTFTTATGASEVTRTLIARDGPFRREELLGPNGSAYLFLPQGTFVVVPGALVYSDTTPTSGSTAEPTSLDESSEPIFREGGSEALYRELGDEDVAGRRLQKYQIAVNGSAATNVSNTETLMWFDAELGMPVRSEIRSSNGNSTVIELTEIKREVDAQLFQIPKNYRKVTPEEVRQQLGRKP